MGKEPREEEYDEDEPQDGLLPLTVEDLCEILDHFDHAELKVLFVVRER